MEYECSEGATRNPIRTGFPKEPTSVVTINDTSYMFVLCMSSISKKSRAILNMDQTNAMFPNVILIRSHLKNTFLGFMTIANIHQLYHTVTGITKLQNPMIFNDMVNQR